MNLSHDDPHDEIARARMICAEQWTPELVETLVSAVANDKGWLRRAQALLRKIHARELPDRGTAAHGQ